MTFPPPYPREILEFHCPALHFAKTPFILTLTVHLGPVRRLCFPVYKSASEDSKLDPRVVHFAVSRLSFPSNSQSIKQSPIFSPWRPLQVLPSQLAIRISPLIFLLQGAEGMGSPRGDSWGLAHSSPSGVPSCGPHPRLPRTKQLSRGLPFPLRHLPTFFRITKKDSSSNPYNLGYKQLQSK